jgi:hypothetical protein
MSSDIVWPERLSGRPESASRLRSEAESVVAGLLDAAGRDLRAVFLAGSLAVGEAVLVSGPDGRDLCLSDLDLGLVLRDGRDRDRVRVAATRWLSGDSAGPARRFFAGLDVGVYATSDLEAQPLKPGTLEVSQTGVVLWGDDAALRAWPRFATDRIPLAEARSLLANRTAELLRAAHAAPAPDRAYVRAFDAAYAAGKTVLDAGTALLVATGAYRVGLGPRLDAMMESSAVREAMADGTGRYLDAARFWTAIRLGTEEWGSVRARYPGASVPPEALWEEARLAVERSWEWLRGRRTVARAGPGFIESARRWRAWGANRSWTQKLAGLARAPFLTPRESVEAAAVLLFTGWAGSEAGALVPMELERAAARLLPGSARARRGSTRSEWCRALLAAREALARAGDE